MVPLLLVEIKNGRWEYSMAQMSEKQIAELDLDSKWSPSILDEDEFVLLNILCRREKLMMDDVEKSIGNPNRLQMIINHLQYERLAYVQEGQLFLSTRKCVCMIHPDLGYIAGDDYDGRVTAWLNNRISKKHDPGGGV